MDLPRALDSLQTAFKRTFPTTPQEQPPEHLPAEHCELSQELKYQVRKGPWPWG